MNNGIEDWVKREVFTKYVQLNSFRLCTATMLTTDNVHFLFTAYPVQCYWQFHSGQLVGLSKLPPVSSMLALPLSAPDPLCVATQLAHLQESLGSLSRAWVGCSQVLEWDQGWILLFCPVSGGRWWCQQGSLYLNVNTIIKNILAWIPVVALPWQP